MFDRKYSCAQTKSEKLFQTNVIWPLPNEALSKHLSEATTTALHKQFDHLPKGKQRMGQSVTSTFEAGNELSDKNKACEQENAPYKTVDKNEFLRRQMC
jgi:hypothetical protein